MARQELGDWTNAAEIEGHDDKLLKALLKARSEFEASLKALHPGAQFSYKNGLVKSAWPKVEAKASVPTVKAKGNGKATTDMAAIVKALIAAGVAPAEAARIALAS